jgi:hypothetical protein
MVLPRASCKRCSDITSELERSILRGELQHLRAKLRLRTRRPQETIRTYPLTIITDAGAEEIQVPIEEVPIVLPAPIFLPPAFLDSRDYTSGIQVVGARGIKWGPDPEEVGKLHKAKQVSISVQTRPAEFARMLAKIAYSYSVAELGRAAFNAVFVVPAILGGRGDVGRWVGSGPDSLRIPTGALHYLQLDIVLNSGLAANEVLAIVHIKLFAESPTPVYSVVVGTISVEVYDGD